MPVKFRPGDGNTGFVILSEFERPVSEAAARSGALLGAPAKPLNVAVIGLVRAVFDVSRILAVPLTIKLLLAPYAPGPKVIRTLDGSLWRTTELIVCAGLTGEME